MIILGIVLLLIGAAVATFARGDAARLGYYAAGLGLILIVLALVLGLLDEADDNGNNIEGLLMLPLLARSRFKK